MRALLLAAALLFARGVEAKCMRIELEPKLVTAKTAVVPTDGGVLVGYDGSTDAPRNEGDPSVRTAWATGGVTLETLAPGLTVYRTTGKRLALGPANKPLGSFTLGVGPKLDLPAPAPSTITYATSPGFRRTEDVRVTAAFTAVPAQAVALVLYKLDGAKRIPQSYALVGKDQLSFDVYASPGHCGVSVTGTQVPAPTDTVGLAWVDQFGRLSAPGASLKLTIRKSAGE